MFAVSARRAERIEIATSPGSGRLSRSQPAGLSGLKYVSIQMTDPFSVSARRAERIEIVQNGYTSQTRFVSARRAERIEINVTFAVQPSAVSQPAGLSGLKCKSVTRYNKKT